MLVFLSTIIILYKLVNSTGNKNITRQYLSSIIFFLFTSDKYS